MVQPAVAGDRALLDVVGYSESGQYFAFEEFGVQDGSGFAYSSIYIVDLPADKWMYGSPFHVQATEEAYDRPLADIRAEARAKANERLDELGITVPAETLILLGDGVPDAVGHQMEFAAPGGGPPGYTDPSRLRLTLNTFPVDSPNDCETLIGEQALGFSLNYIGPDGVAHLVHLDGESIPRSRGCTMEYRLYAVVGPFQSTGSRVAIVSSYPFGFEGPDRRFLAVPLEP
jgi:predicted secreted protein